MAGGSNRFLYSKYSRIIFLKQHSFKNEILNPFIAYVYASRSLTFPQTFSVQMYRDEGKVCCKGQFYLSDAKLSRNNKVYVFLFKISFLW